MKPIKVINRNGNFECLTTLIITTSSKVKKLFLDFPLLLKGWSNFKV